MDDLISRKEAIEWVQNILTTHLYYHPCSKSRNVPIDEVIDRLERVPSIDAVQYTDDEIQRMQDIEQAQIQKAYDLGYAEGKADAVPVIRCKDCKYRYIKNDVWTCPFGLPSGPDGYCSYGERKES